MQHRPALDRFLSATGITQQGGAAGAEFGRMMGWILAAGVLMVAGALFYLSLFGALTVHMVVATTLGVFLSVVLGSGLFAAAFFSSKSGYDQSVTDATGRHAPAANAERLPDGLERTRRTPDFTEQTVPAALLADHNLKEGSWGLIHVEAGQLRYHVTDSRREALTVVLTPETPPAVIEPTILHHVEPLGDVRFHVEFWRVPEREHPSA